MSVWNFDISQAPKAGRIIAAGNGGTVTVSSWNVKREAWSMFTKETPPLAWMPWPQHPEAENEIAAVKGGEA